MSPWIIILLVVFGILAVVVLLKLIAYFITVKTMKSGMKAMKDFMDDFKF